MLTHLSRRRGGPEDGATLVLTSLLMVVLLGIAALVVDLGNARQSDLAAQAGADAAALAGAGTLQAGGTAAEATASAQAYAARNGFGTDHASVRVPPASGPYAGDGRCVEVLTDDDVPTTFGRVLGHTSVAVAGRAVSCTLPPTSGVPAVFGGSTTCPATVEWAGSSVTVTGGVHSNRDIKMSGSNNVVSGHVSYVTGIDAGQRNTFTPSAGNPAQAAGPMPYPVGFILADYGPTGARAALASGQGLYHDAGGSDIDVAWLESRGLWNSVTRQITPGLYHTTGDIDLSSSSITAKGVTMVAGGQISLSGSAHTLTPWDPEGLVLFSDHQASSDGDTSNCTSAGVKMSGSSHSWSGIIYAPRSQIEISGSTTSAVRGSLIGLTVNLSGSRVSLAYDPEYRVGTAELGLVE